ncbi:MAG: flagellar motor switch protein FliM [Lachnospiraceae bacterium]|nr:flagellar motor switch protein FliM [Lachnospiraceae bacterium]MBQ5376273.1 flagellar motor switch protein FliM [Lachnospiraceae bacterium]MCR5320510.1 flagellar motor switch protein FliM [Lachnospiraceae bacterium]
MGEVLSQDEIDNLLAALSTGEIDADQIKDSAEKQVKDYDFKRPAKFSKEHLRTLEIIFEHYGRLLSTNLPVYLRKNVQVSVNSSETVTFSEFSNALSNPVILSIINFQPLTGNIIMELSPNLGFSMIDRMLGGKGLPLEKSRDFSEIELTLLERIMVICMQLLREPWKNVLDINPTLDRIETNPQFAQIIAPSEMIAIVTLNIKVGDVEGLMNICLPYFTLENIMDKLNTKFWFSTIQDSSDEDYEAYIEAMIKRVHVPIRAVLGKSSISVGDFTSLQTGDVIRLDNRVDNELAIYVGNLKKFMAVPGSSKDKYAVRVTSILGEEG